jgi:hypothetical protein
MCAPMRIRAGLAARGRDRRKVRVVRRICYVRL